MAAAGIDGASSIQVTVRVRPFTIREAAQLTRSDEATLFLGDGSLAAVPTPQLKSKGLRPVIKVVDEKCLVFDPPDTNPVHRFSRTLHPTGKRVKDQTFGFDRVFDDNTTQADVYEATTKNLLDSVLDGYNATIFAYGATGCGKTHTITGTAQQPGIIFLTMQELFEKVDDVKGEKESEITLSYLEIYNETIRDLLNPGAGSKQGLMLREDANQAVSVAGLSSHKPQNVQEVMDMVIRGNGARTQSPTEANATSSRSHAVLQVNIQLKSRDSAVREPLTMATLSIIDLAGSERASATKNRGERLLEGANINKSLLALGSCINALCDARKNNHVPYRNSKLTRLLKFSLGGNCRTVMIVCVSPSSAHFDETQNTLRYANRAKNIQTKSVRNVYNVDRHVKDYLKKIDEQMERINELTVQQKQYEEVAFAKFRKLEAKRAELAQEGLQRIRLAYEHAGPSRSERVADTRRLRGIERRISAISAWIGAFDQLCETRGEEGDPPRSLAGMRKAAHGILVELEGSRQHYHLRLGGNNWARAVETALTDSVRQLQALDGFAAGSESVEEASLRREVELLKQRAEIEAHASLLEDARSADSGLQQVLLTAHFETLAILNQILQMSEREALEAAKGVLGGLMLTCSEAVGQVIKPDGGLQILDALPTTATRNGTPRKRRPAPLLGASPLKTKVRPGVVGSAVPAHVLPVLCQTSPNAAGSSPAGAGGRVMASPRRRVVKLGAARSRVVITAGTPNKKKSPGKKRAVRWRDDAEDGGPLVEFQSTPRYADSTPPQPPLQPPLLLQERAEDGASATLAAPPVLPQTVDAAWDASSPLPIAPMLASSETRKSVGTGRFALGALASKAAKYNGSPPPPKLSSLAGLASSSEDETSPLREMAANAAARRGSQLAQPTASGDDSGQDSVSGASGSDTEGERAFSLADKETAGKIRSALKRNSSLSTSGPTAHHRRSHGSRSRSRSARDSTQHTAGRESAAHTQQHHRRRSPTATSPAPDTGAFSASHARRMVKPERDEALRSVLSPRSAPVVKTAGPVPVYARRSLVESTQGMPTEGVGKGGRVSCVVPGSAQRAANALAGKSGWR